MANFIRGEFAPDGPIESEDQQPSGLDPEIDPELGAQMKGRAAQPTAQPAFVEGFKNYNSFVDFCNESAGALEVIFKKHFPHTNLDFSGLSQMMAAYFLDALLRRKG